MGAAAQLWHIADVNDPCSSLLAATPDEIKSRGRGLTIIAGVAVSPFGTCLIGETARGICHLAFFDDTQRATALAAMHSAWPLATVVWDDGHAAFLAAKVFTVRPVAATAAPWKLLVRGTPFQLCVWRALLRVPAGTRVSYGQLAAATGKPTACRATGAALAANPIAFLIPCHRVIHASGKAGNYRWGTARKLAILTWENSGIEPVF